MFSRMLRLPLGTVISGIGIFVPGISLSMFIIGLILVAAGLFIYFTEAQQQSHSLQDARKRPISQNVVAKYVPASMALDSAPPQRRSSSLHMSIPCALSPRPSPQLIGHAPLLHKIIFYCMAGLVAVLFIRLLPASLAQRSSIRFSGSSSLIASVYVLAAAACIVAQAVVSRPIFRAATTTHRPSRCSSPLPVCSSTPTSASAT